MNGTSTPARAQTQRRSTQNTVRRRGEACHAVRSAVSCRKQRSTGGPSPLGPRAREASESLRAGVKRAGRAPLVGRDHGLTEAVSDPVTQTAMSSRAAVAHSHTCGAIRSAQSSLVHTRGSVCCSGARATVDSQLTDAASYAPSWSGGPCIELH
jgi:hypothetical protein